MKPLTKLVILASCGVVYGVAERSLRKKSAEAAAIALREKLERAAAFQREIDQLEALNDDLDRRIEAGKFWLIVTNPDNP